MSASEEKPTEIKTSTKDVVIAYYSRSGTTKIAAEALCQILEKKGDNVELVQICVDQANEGYLYNGYMAVTGKSLEIKSENVMIGKNAKEVWLCGPVHAWSLCSALKKYIELNVETLKAEGVIINALVTMGGSGENGFYKGIEDIVGKKLTQKIAFTSSTVKDSAALAAKFDEFFKPKEEPKAEETKPDEAK